MRCGAERKRSAPVDYVSTFLCGCMMYARILLRAHCSRGYNTECARMCGWTIMKAHKKCGWLRKLDVHAKCADDGDDDNDVDDDDMHIILIDDRTGGSGSMVRAEREFRAVKKNPRSAAYTCMMYSHRAIYAVRRKVGKVLYARSHTPTHTYTHKLARAEMTLFMRSFRRWMNVYVCVCAPVN